MRDVTAVIMHQTVVSYTLAHWDDALWIDNNDTCVFKHKWDSGQDRSGPQKVVCYPGDFH